MKVSHFKVGKDLCMDCSLALRRFIGGMDGVESVEAENGLIAVRFDENTIAEDTLSRITRDSIERLGYRLNE